MKLYLLSLGLLIFVFGSTLSQTPNDIKNANFIKAQDLRIKLGLNLEKSLYLEEILNRYNLELREIVLDSRRSDRTFGQQYAGIKSKRDKELRALLDDQQMKLFALLEKSEIQDIKDYYTSLVESLSQNEEFTNYLSIYYRNHQSPIILKHKASLNQKINEADSIELSELRLSFNEILDDAINHPNDNSMKYADLKLGKVIKTLGEEKPEYIEVWDRIKKISKRYSKNIKEEYKGIDYHRRDWNNGLKKILREYLHEEKTAVENQMYFTLTQFGISEKVNRYVFLLFDESDINTYFELKQKIQKLFVKVSI